MKDPEVPRNSADTTNPLPEPLTWAATPLEVYGRQDIQEQQKQVSDEISRRTEQSLPDDAPEELKEFIVVNVAQRFHQQNMENYDSYAARLDTELLNIDLGSIEMFERAKTGHATPGELLRVRNLLGMSSIELAKISHPGGIALQYLKPMRQAVREGILANQGEIYDRDQQHHELKIHNSSSLIFHKDGQAQDLVGVAMRRRRWLGTVDEDTRVFEKTRFILRTDEASGLKPRTLGMLRTIELANNPIWTDEVMHVPSLEAEIFDALKQRNQSVAFLLSTTAHAFNLSTSREIEAKAAAARKEARMHSLDRMDAAGKLKAQRRTIEDLDTDMPFFQ